MKKPTRPSPRRRFFYWMLVSIAMAGLGSGCVALPASVNPASPPARPITDLSWLLFGVGWLIWLGVMFTLNTMRGISQLIPFNEVVLEVTGYQWWWDVRYPSQWVITANEIHIPVGRLR